MSSSAAGAAPFGGLAATLSAAELRETAYELLVAACRSPSSRPLTYRSRSGDRSSPALQRSMTSSAASTVKRALGLKNSMPSKSSTRKSVPAVELVRGQLGISEQTDSRIRKGLLRIAAGNLGRRVDSMVLPLEFLQQFRPSDFSDKEEYEVWKMRHLKILETGLLLHPFLPLEKSDAGYQRLQQLIHQYSDSPLESGKSEAMQNLRNAVMSLAGRSFDGYSSETCHWADGLPLNLYLYQILLETCFDNNVEEGSIVDEIDEILDLIKKTWVILGIDQLLHNLCFTWVLFHKFVTTGEEDIDLLLAADNQLVEVAKDAKTTRDPVLWKILSSTLTSIHNWAEKKLFSYHDTFSSDNFEIMQCVVSLGVSSAMILDEDISSGNRRKRKEETNAAQSMVDTCIRSSLRAAFALRMEQAYSSRRASRSENGFNPVLSLLAKDIGDLAVKEKEVYSLVLKKWHPLAAGIAVATLHSCYGNELKQFISGIMELTSEAVEVLKAADKLEKDLVNIAVEDSVDSEDGGKSLIQEMPPYEAEFVIGKLAREWIKTRLERLQEWVERLKELVEKEGWKPGANSENCSSSAIEVLRIVDETVDAFFQLPIPMLPALLPDLLIGLDQCLQSYASKLKSGVGTRSSFIPPLPALTRCDTGSKLWKKKDRSQKRRPQSGSSIGDSSLGLPQLCIRMNSLYYIRKGLTSLEKKIKTCLRNPDLAQSNLPNGFEISFERSLTSCQDGILQICETTAYKVVFHDLSHVLLDALYIGEIAASRIDPLLKELDLVLESVSRSVHDRVRSRVISALMKASFDGFLLVLLAGGPTRAFSCEDYPIIEDDFGSLRDLFSADGDGLPEELIMKVAAQVKSVLPLFQTNTESLIEQFKHMTAEMFGLAAKSKYPLPQTSGHWSPSEANTVLRVLCYRNDEAATKFLKKTYNLPKKL